jgi:transposase-like protein
VSYKDRREFINDLKPVYKSATENEALNALESLENKWSGKYRFAVKSWRDNWNELSTMFKYPPEIRRLIYTTNAIESFNRQLRKATKTKSAFVSDDAAMKLLYLTTMKVVEKWTMQLRDWGQIISTLSIYFGDRVTMKK